MIGNQIYCLLFAQMKRFDGLRDRFNPRSRMETGEIVTVVLLVVGVLAALVIFGRLRSRFSGRSRFNSPRAMFRELCRAHELDRKSRDLLKSVASWQRLTQPARLFLEPERFEAANLSPQLQQQAAELLELRSRLFTFEITEPVAQPVAPAVASATATADTPAPENQPTEAIGAAAFAHTTLE